MKNFKIAYLTTWPPKECGIATFARDLAKEIEKAAPEISWRVIAIDSPNKNYHYDSKVVYKINETSTRSYYQAARFINQSDIDLLVVQHEYNLYGKQGGGRILPLLKTLKKPTVVILHSLPAPDDRKYKYKKKKIEIVKKMSFLVQKMVALCGLGKERLVKIYKVKPEKIVVIPHGSPEFPKTDSRILKKTLGFENDFLLLNFGFMGRRKGLETIIRAMPKIIRVFPNTKLVFLGGGNPASLKEFKNYLKELQTLAQKLKVSKNVDFVTGFIPIKRAMEYYKAANVFICGNNFKSQISSGPLTYAVASGKAVVSSDFTFAEDLLKNGRGLLYSIGDHRTLATAVCKILENPKLKKDLETKNSIFGKHLLWNQVAKNYITLFKEVTRK